MKAADWDLVDAHWNSKRYVVVVVNEETLINYVRSFDRFVTWTEILQDLRPHLGNWRRHG